MRRIAQVLAITAVFSISLAAANPGWAGKWKENIAKSDFTAATITYEKLPSGEWQSTADGVSYKFGMDGKEYPDNMGDIAIWKSIDSTTWQTGWKVNGKLAATDTVRIGADGILTVSTKGSKPSGEAIDQTTTYQRVSGGPGLAGTWKSKAVQDNAPLVIELIATPDNGSTFKSNYGSVCSGKTDGKDQPCSGALTPSGWTASVTTSGGRLNATMKKDGKPIYRYEYSVSPDGKTLTQIGGAVATNEKTKVVFDRQ